MKYSSPNKIDRSPWQPETRRPKGSMISPFHDYPERCKIVLPAPIEWCNGHKEGRPKPYWITSSINKRVGPAINWPGNGQPRRKFGPGSNSTFAPDGREKKPLKVFDLWSSFSQPVRWKDLQSSRFRDLAAAVNGYSLSGPFHRVTLYPNSPEIRHWLFPLSSIPFLPSQGSVSDD